MALTTAEIVSADLEGIEKAAKLVLTGGIVAYPTDTVYGLGCNPSDDGAVARLIRVKQRTKGTLPILVNSMASARKLGEFDGTSLRLAGKFWPGLLTLVVRVLEKLPTPITDNSSFVGLRIPKHETALNLIGGCGGRIVGTSANITGHLSSLSANQVLSEVGDRVDLILEGGPSPLGKESTVAKTFGGGVEILREGAISGGEILKALRTA